MKIEFNGISYTIRNKVGFNACAGCIIYERKDLKCPLDSEGHCILPMNKIYTDVNFLQVFKL